MRSMRVCIALLGFMLLAGSSALALPASESQVYLPVVLGYPPPESPVLNEILPPNADPFYVVGWGAAERASSYALQQASDPGFPAPADVYAGSETSTNISSEGIQTYYYRVKALNPFGASSGWSNTRSVAVCWEREPNDPWNTNANGPLASGELHYGYQNDRKDFFWFDAGKGGTIRINLVNPSAKGVQLQLLVRSGADLILLAYRSAPPYHIEHNGDVGRYYVYIYAESQHNSSQPYALSAEYPQ